MTRFERWLLRRTIRTILQGDDHINDTTELFGILRQEWKRAFYEDNDKTREFDLFDHFIKSRKLSL